MEGSRQSRPPIKDETLLCRMSRPAQLAVGGSWHGVIDAGQEDERGDCRAPQKLDECRQIQLEDREMRGVGQTWLLDEVATVYAIEQECAMEEEVCEMREVVKEVVDVGQGKSLSSLRGENCQSSALGIASKAYL